MKVFPKWMNIIFYLKPFIISHHQSFHQITFNGTHPETQRTSQPYKHVMCLYSRLSKKTKFTEGGWCNTTTCICLELQISVAAYIFGLKLKWVWLKTQGQHHLGILPLSVSQPQLHHLSSTSLQLEMHAEPLKILLTHALFLFVPVSHIFQQI